MTVYLKYLDIYLSHKLVSYIQSNFSAKMCLFHSWLNLKVTITTQHSTEADAFNSVNFWRDEKWDRYWLSRLQNVCIQNLIWLFSHPNLYNGICFQLLRWTFVQSSELSQILNAWALKGTQTILMLVPWGYGTWNKEVESYHPVCQLRLYQNVFKSRVGMTSTRNIPLAVGVFRGQSGHSPWASCHFLSSNGWWYWGWLFGTLWLGVHKEVTTEVVQYPSNWEHRVLRVAQT